jgi:DNA-directed RNA polymerase III subunit RPC6
MARSIKGLEQKGMIKPMINIENPTRKIYIVSTLQPADEMTGGPWYNDDGTGELDEEFIRVLSTAAHKFVTSRSWIMQREPVSKGIKRDSAGVTKDEPPGPSKREPGSKVTNYLPLPAGYKDYPTLKSIKRYLNALGVTGVTIDDQAMEQLLDVLIFDGKIEKVSNGTAYKAVRERIDGSPEAGVGNGLTEAPCGTCPVFDLCEEGGPVSASSCKYFATWLEI